MEEYEAILPRHVEADVVRGYLENRLRETFGFDGTPIRLVFRDRASVKLPRRRKTRSSPVTKGRRASPPRTRRPS